MRRLLNYPGIIFLFIIFCVSTGEADSFITKGKRVKLDYTLRVNGEVLDTTLGKSPLEFVQGDGTIIPGLTKQLEGLRRGDTKKIIVEPPEAYGLIDPKAFLEAPVTILPKGTKAQRGLMVTVEGEKGRKYNAVIWDIQGDNILLNFNHPLAGQKLQFDIKVLEVKG